MAALLKTPANEKADARSAFSLRTPPMPHSYAASLQNSGVTFNSYID